MNNFLKYILDFIFPIECAGCGEELHTPNPSHSAVAQGKLYRGELKWLCDYCFSKIEFNKEQICPLCGRFLKLGYSCICVIKKGLLKDYEVRKNKYSSRGLYVDKLRGFNADTQISNMYNGVDVYVTFVDLKKNPQVMKLIHKLKYGFIEDAAKELARMGIEFLRRNNLREKLGLGCGEEEKGISNFRFQISKKYQNLNSKFQKNAGEGGEGKENVIFIPVPLHKKRLLWRGFNQSELILREMGNLGDGKDEQEGEEGKEGEKKLEIRNWKLEICGDILARKKNTFFQGKIKMREKDRILNMRGAFEARGKLDGKAVVLFDDVITTGATMEECARVLKKAGATRVIAMAVGKG